MRIGLLAALVLVGCEREPASRDSDCGSAVAALIKAAQEPNEKPPADTQTAIAKRCVDDRWTPDALQCLQRAQTYERVEDCRYTQLTRQQDDLLQPLLEAIDPGATEVVTATERMWTKMCACKDSACAMSVSDELKTWKEDFMRKRHSPPRINPTKREQLKAMNEQFVKCLRRAVEPQP